MFLVSCFQRHKKVCLLSSTMRSCKCSTMRHLRENLTGNPRQAETQAWDREADGEVPLPEYVNIAVHSSRLTHIPSAAKDTTIHAIHCFLSRGSLDLRGPLRITPSLSLDGHAFRDGPLRNR